MAQYKDKISGATSSAPDGSGSDQSMAGNSQWERIGDSPVADENYQGPSQVVPAQSVLPEGVVAESVAAKAAQYLADEGAKNVNEPSITDSEGASQPSPTADDVAHPAEGPTPAAG